MRQRAAWAAPRRHSIAAVLALHGVLLVGLWLALRPGPRPPPQRAGEPLVVKLLPLPERRLPPPQALHALPVNTPPAPREAGPRPAAPTPRAAPITRPFTLEPAPVAAAPHAEPPASAPQPETPLLDTDATRRALREAARSPLLAERAAAATQAPDMQRPAERLGSEIARSAKGDCLKGEYAGGGMGLLSLPFLAAAALRDQCRR